MGREWDEAKLIESEDAYIDEFHQQLEEEFARKRKIRQLKAKHRKVITRCNILILFESITLVFLVIALILQF